MHSSDSSITKVYDDDDNIYDGSVCIKMFNWFAEVDTGQFNHTQEGQTVSFLRYSEVESDGMEWADVGSEQVCHRTSYHILLFRLANRMYFSKN
jgi:hypothetical protein